MLLLVFEMLVGVYVDRMASFGRDKSSVVRYKETESVNIHLIWCYYDYVTCII